jgi:translation elongation factor EF-G
MSQGKKHVSIVICGHVDAGKSTTTGRLIFELGGISEREMVSGTRGLAARPTSACTVLTRGACVRMFLCVDQAER